MFREVFKSALTAGIALWFGGVLLAGPPAQATHKAAGASAKVDQLWQGIRADADRIHEAS